MNKVYPSAAAALQGIVKDGQLAAHATSTSALL